MSRDAVSSESRNGALRSRVSRRQCGLMSTDTVRAERLAKALEAMNDASARRRRDAVITVAALGGAGGYEPLLAALRDLDRKVRFNAMLGLYQLDTPAAHADAIVSALATHGSGAPEAAAAAEVVRLRVGPGVLTRLGIVERLMPEIERLAEVGDSRRARRQAALLAGALRPRT